MMVRSFVLGTMLLSVAIAATPASAQSDNAPKGVSIAEPRHVAWRVQGHGQHAGLRDRRSTVELAAGGQTGREQFRVPTFVYVIEGILTTDYEAGPVGIKGAQYHAAGQSFMDQGGWWHNHIEQDGQAGEVPHPAPRVSWPSRSDPEGRVRLDSDRLARPGRRRSPAGSSSTSRPRR